MQEGAGRIAGGLLLLIALWVGVYWWWPHESKITFAQGEDAVRGVAPKTPDQPPSPGPKRAPEPDAPQVIIPPEFTRYTVKSGDTFATIAKHFFGSEAMASVIARANPEVSPPTLSAGRVLLIPKDPNNIQGIPVKSATKTATKPTTKTDEPASSEQTVVVQSGDTLSKIAQEAYGDFRLAPLIFEANRDQLSNEHDLKIGQKLKIPPRPPR